MLIRPYRREDVAGIGRVHAESRRSAYVDLVPPDALARVTPRTQASYWAERLAREPAPHSVQVAEAERIIGFVLGSAAGDTATLNAIHVLPSRHGSGVGQALHDGVLEEFVAWGCVQARLWVLEGNQRAQSFYRRNGWVLDGGRDETDIGGAVVPVVRYCLTLPATTFTPTQWGPT